MTTFADLTDEVLTNLHGMTSDLESLTSLTQTLGTGDVSFTVDDVSQLSRGLIEVDSELMWVKNIDTTSNTVNLAAFGRGFRESTAATHATDTMVMNNPRFPRANVKAAIQQTLSEVYPELFQVAADESNTVNPVVTTYSVPAACDTVLQVSWQQIGPSKAWTPVRHYRLVPQADTTSFPTGKSIDISDRMVPGRTIRVTYAAAPGALSADGDTLVSTGLGETVRDVLVFGACYRLLASLEASRLQSMAVEQSERAGFVPVQAATAASKYYLGLFQTRLANERARLLQLYPTTAHLTR